MVDKWDWDRRNIREHREKHEPYDWYQKLMMNLFTNNPFFLDMWKSSGVTESVDSVGSVLLTKRRGDTFEQVLLTDEGEVLDFEYDPKKPEPQIKTELSPRDIERAKELIKKLRKERRFKKCKL